MKATRMLLVMLLVTVGFATMALAAGPNPDCPDADNDGICNGQDPDYVPDCECNPDCPDHDGDGICNCEDPDWVPPGRGRPGDRTPTQAKSPATTRAGIGWLLFGPATGF